jgi:DNA-binding NarL/FixJ family response regulator
LRELELGYIDDEITHLSKRERELLPLLADGKSVQEIADKLFISPKTVESHKYNIMEKLNVSSLTAITKLAIKKKLIEI